MAMLMRAMRPDDRIGVPPWAEARDLWIGRRQIGKTFRTSAGPDGDCEARAAFDQGDEVDAAAPKASYEDGDWAAPGCEGQTAHPDHGIENEVYEARETRSCLERRPVHCQNLLES